MLDCDNFVMAVSCFPCEVHVAIPTPHGFGCGGISDLLFDSTPKLLGPPLGLSYTKKSQTPERICSL